MAELKPRSRIVRAWFDTIINPLIQALEVEEHFLSKGNWTWRFHTSRFEHLAPIQDHLTLQGRVNLEQFVFFESEAGQRIREHDDAIENLRTCCKALEAILVQAIEALRPLALTTTQALADIQVWVQQFPVREADNDLQQFVKEYPDPKWSQLLAQYILNHQEELPRHYTTSGFWNQYRHNFLKLLEYPASSIQVPYRAVMNAGRSLEVRVSELVKNLKVVRNRLSIEHDVPLMLPEKNETEVEKF